MAMVTYPLNNVQYNAEDAELYNAVRMSGVWSGSAFDAEVTGNDTIVTVGDGLAWIANTKFSGKVVAQKEPKSIDLGAADPSYNRIDVIAIQFNSVENRTDVIVKKGVASSNPEIPARSTTESLYELYLYSVLRTAGSSVISKSNITDLRDNREYCGYMQDATKPGYAPSLMEHNKGEDFRFWKGTKAEYKAQGDNLAPNMFCVVMDDNDIVDYVIEQSEENGWTYRKWNSGIVECWGAFTKLEVLDKATLNNIIRGYAQISYPSFVKTIEAVNYSTYWSNGYDWCGKVLIDATNKVVNIYLLSLGEVNKYASAYPHIIGRWK